MRLSILLAFVAAAAATQWDPEVRLTDNTYSDFAYWSCQRRVAVDPEGRIHVAWHVMNSGLGTYRFQIHYTRFNPGSGWTQDTMISADLYSASTYCKYASLGVDSTGRVYAVWAGGSTEDGDEAIYLKTCMPSGSGNDGWDQTSRVLSTQGPTYEKGCPNVSSTPNGNVQVTWLEAQGSTISIAFRERVDTTWQAQRNLETSTSYKAYPAVAAGPDNRVHVIWYGRSGPSGYYDVFYKARTDTAWGPTEEVSYGDRHQMYPSIAVNPATGNPHVLWQCYETVANHRRIVHAWRSAAGWQPRDSLSEADTLLPQSTGQIAFTPDGRGHAVWGGRSRAWPNLDQVRYCERSAVGDWSAPFNLTDSSGSKERPSVAAGGSAAPNDVHVVWSDYRSGLSEFYYRHGSPGSGVADAPGAGTKLTAATVVRRVLWLGAMGHDPKRRTFRSCPAVLLDVAGRAVMRLRPGRNDLGHLAPGVYLVVDGGRVDRVAVVR